VRGQPKQGGSDARGTGKKRRSLELAVPNADILSPATCPPDLPAEIVPIWDDVIGDLCGRPSGSAIAYRTVDLIMVRALVEAVWSHTRASCILRDEGVLLDTERGPVKHPAFAIQKDSAATILRYSEMLGLNPAARVRLAVTEAAGMSLLASIGKQLER